MYLNIECCEKNGDVFIHLVDKSEPYKPSLIAIMKRDFDAMGKANYICQCVNNFDDLLEVCKIGLSYVKNANGCNDPTCLVCKKHKEDAEKIRVVVANTKKENK